MAKKVTIAAFVLIATTPYVIGQTMSKTECNVLKVAEKAIAAHFPDFYPTSLKPVVTEKGKLWELTYELPIGVLGGVPIVVIDKTTCEIVRIVHTQ